MKKLIAFDLDGTLAVSKSPITDEMSELMGRLLNKYQVCVISGGAFAQFKTQLIDNLKVEHHLLEDLHLMPTCGTRYMRFDDIQSDWKEIYAKNLSDEEKKKIIQALEEGAKKVGLWEKNPKGEIIEDRDSQITLSALGQLQTPEVKEAWDPDGRKKAKIREEVARLLPEFEVRTGGTTSVDVTYPGIDKAYGMEKLMETLEVGKSEVLFIGDALQEGGNDYPVKAYGIDCIAVKDWEDTALIIETLIKV